MNDRVLLAALILATLTGCVMTPSDLRTESMPWTFNVDESYQNVYRTIKTKSTDCWGTNNLWASYYPVSGDLYTDIQQAHVYIGGIVGSNNYYVLLDITAITENKTQVVTYVNKYTSSYFHDMPIVIKGWFNGNDTCDTQQDRSAEGE